MQSKKTGIFSNPKPAPVLENRPLQPFVLVFLVEVFVSTNHRGTSPKRASSELLKDTKTLLGPPHFGQHAPSTPQPATRASRQHTETSISFARSPSVFVLSLFYSYSYFRHYPYSETERISFVSLTPLSSPQR
ncbi:hypothetical protein H0G86_003651 [Trichoderma simmonsii]|uniref:Uncharacterized protein n=1 Tax=Trichoderma simmonsii TaxID=1491479 RepID=A0A8G0PEM5_9HYPO|nr:hypothetical protein H0G86_003651 [Trichoderma simmonsii]